LLFIAATIGWITYAILTAKRIRKRLTEAAPIIIGNGQVAPA
jgi:hypothetical protein